ncbi:MAG TPA: hypothetical protein PKC18_09125 [Lacipirellulaceae bacterium]|nr:hypothetical protein [Lacipirellulaceae bacterium]HMP04984.1 hypothetical protein [Lacipirellulaceae bacterium]
MDSVLQTAASHRDSLGVVIDREPDGAIRQVRIGRWRVVATTGAREIAEVRRLAAQRVAVRLVHRGSPLTPSAGEMWQLYRTDGRLEASLQRAADGRLALLSNHRTRRASWLAMDADGAVRCLEQWAM